MKDLPLSTPGAEWAFNVDTNYNSSCIWDGFFLGGKWEFQLLPTNQICNMKRQPMAVCDDVNIYDPVIFVKRQVEFGIPKELFM